MPVRMPALGCRRNPPMVYGRRTLISPRRLVAVTIAAGFAASCTSASIPTPSPATTTASPSTATTTSPSPEGEAWLTYQHDAGRSGMATTGPSANTPRLAWRSSAALDGAVYAQPLVFDGRVIVATENDSIYALSVGEGQVVWRTHLGTPVARSSLPCGNIDPTGITGTPVIDASAGTVWVVAFVRPGRHVLAALDLTNGAVRSR